MSLGLSVEVRIYSFLTSALDEVEWSVFTPQLYAGETAVPTKQGLGGSQSLSEHGEQECLRSL